MSSPSTPPASIFSRHSSYIENCIRHIFLASVTQSLWLLDQNKRVQIFTSEVDDFGYDIVLTLDAVTRHIQLKQTHTDAKAVKADINVALSQAKGGCVVWVFYEPSTLNIKHYLYFGARHPEHAMPSLDDFEHATRNTWTKAGVRPVRRNIRRIPKNHFTKILPDEIITTLFGPTNRAG